MNGKSAATLVREIDALVRGITAQKLGNLPKDFFDNWRWVVAVDAYDYGDTEPLTQLLASEREYPENVRVVLADIVAGKRKPSKKRSAHAKIKSMQTGRVLEKTFRGSDKLEDVRVERRAMQFLYREGENLVCMDNETYNQLSLDANMMTPGTDFLKEGEQVSILMTGEIPVAAEMPMFVELEITDTDPGFKGDTVSGATKAATVETGGTVQVPLFIEQGEIIKIDTRSSEYLERVRK